MNEDVKQLAVEADERRYQALFANDFVALEGMLHADYVHVHATGKIDDKAVFVGDLQAGKYRFVSSERSDQRVRRLGSVVLLDGKVSTTISARGELKTIRNAFVTVWNADASPWQLVHWQATKLPDGA